MARKKNNTDSISSTSSSNAETQYVGCSLSPQATIPSVESPSLFTTDTNHVTLSFTHNSSNQYEEPIISFNNDRKNDELLSTTTTQKGYGESVSASTVIYIDDKSVLSQITNQNENNECPEMHIALTENNIVPKTFTAQTKYDKRFTAAIHYDVDEGASLTTAYSNNYKNLDLPSDSSVEYTETSTSYIAQNESDKHSSLFETEIKPIQSASLCTTSLDSTSEPTPPNNVNFTLPSSPSHINNAAFYNTESVRAGSEDKIDTNDGSQKIPAHAVSYSLLISYALLIIFRLTPNLSRLGMDKIVNQ
jgi:hypothetical protein